MPLSDPTLDDLLSDISRDLVVVQRFRGMGRDLWPMTMQPLLFRCAGLAAAAAERVAFRKNRDALLELSAAIIGIMPPDERGNPDDAAWLRLAAAHAAAVDAFAVDQ
jgi:hypothetical protein